MAVLPKAPKIYLSIIPEDGDCEVITIKECTVTVQHGWWNGEHFRDDVLVEFRDEEAARRAGWIRAQHRTYDMIELDPEATE